MSLNPNHPQVLGLYAMLLGAIGRTDDAIAMAQSAIRRDPYHPEWLYDSLGEICWGRRALRRGYRCLSEAPGRGRSGWSPTSLVVSPTSDATRKRTCMPGPSSTTFLKGGPQKRSSSEALTRLLHEHDKLHLLEGYKKAGLVS